jgi:hypothetical protein
MIDRVRETIARYLSGAIDADDLAAHMPDPSELGRAAADETIRRLVLRVIGYVTEFQNGDSTEAELQDRLRLVLPSSRTYWIDQARRTAVASYGTQVVDATVREESEISRVVESV